VGGYERGRENVSNFPTLNFPAFHRQFMTLPATMFRQLLRVAKVGAPASPRFFSHTAIRPRMAIVTGGSRGIGKAISLRLARDGYDITVNDVPENQKLIDSTVSEIEALGRRALGHAADVSNPDAVGELVSASVSALGPLTAMVANAGIVQVKPLLEVTAADWDRMFAVNAAGVHWCFQAAARQMIHQGTPGKLIAAASVAAFRPAAMIGHYSASKWAVRGLCNTYAVELAPHRITVNAYAPGVVDTSMWDLIDSEMSKMQGKPKGEVMKGVEEIIPLGRVSVPEDVAGLVGFLASPDADYITAQTYIVDGGIQNS